MKKMGSVGNEDARMADEGGMIVERERKREKKKGRETATYRGRGRSV